MAEDSGEKTLDPTPERLRQARQKGNVPSSPELQTFARFVGVTIAVMGFLGVLGMQFAESMLRYWDKPEAASLWLMTEGDVLSAFGPTLMLIVGILGLAAVLSLVAVIAQQAVTFAPSKLKPDLSKLSILKNAKNKFGPNGLVEFAKGAVKMVVVSIIGYLIISMRLPELIASAGAPPALMLSEMRSMLVTLLSAAVILAAVAAAIDTPFKWARHQSQLRMSRQEVKDEAKENEGDQTQKQRRQEMARQLAQNTQLADVPTADVVVVNPEHYAVALKWDRTAGEVPRCIAKGIDHLALRIKGAAEEADVPVYRDVPTARSLYATVEVGEEIRRDQYEAVAAAIRFSDALREKRKRS